MEQHGRIAPPARIEGLPVALEDTRKLQALLRILRAIGQAKDLRSLIGLLASETSAAIGAVRSTVFLYDDSRRELWSFIAEGLSEQIWFGIDEGIAGYSFRNSSTEIVNDVSLDPRFNPSIDRMTGFSTRSILSVPIVNTRGYTIGVFQAVNRLEGGFDREDAEFLQAVAGEAAVTLENVALYEQRSRMFDSLIRALADSIEARDPMTAGHSMNVMRYSSGIARNLGLPDETVREIEYAALLHDYGKIGVPDQVLRKPEQLDEEETRVMRSHVDHTRRILFAIEFEENLRSVPRFAIEHHERLDGSGYPGGLSGAEISIGGRVIAVADVFEALTSQRHYRRPMTHADAYRCVTAGSGTEFDPAVVEALGGCLCDLGVMDGDTVRAILSERRTPG